MNGPVGFKGMTDPRNVHPLAPEPGTSEEGIGSTDNDVQTVNVRAGVQLGAMRYVLLIGLIVAIAALGFAWAASS